MSDENVLNELKIIREHLTKTARVPEDYPAQISTTMPYVVDYKNRKHVYIWSGTAMTLTAEDYTTTLVLPANVWMLLDFPVGTRVFNTSATASYLLVKATDELIAMWQNAAGGGSPCCSDELALLVEIGADVDELLLVNSPAVALYTLPSTAITTTPLNSNDLAVANYDGVTIDINTTAQTGTNPTIQYFWERKAADNIYYILWQSAVLTAATNTLSTSVGPGLAYNQALGMIGRIRWVIGGTATPGFTFSVNVQAK